MSTLTKHQRRLVLLVVLVLVLVSAPSIINMLSSPRPLTASVQSPATETSRSVDMRTTEIKQDKPEQEIPEQVESTVQPDNSTESSDVVVTEQTLAEVQPGQESYSQSLEYARDFIAGNWVVVDCERRIVLQCPHKLIAAKPSSDLASDNGNKVWRGHCRDVSINFGSFCRN